MVYTEFLKKMKKEKRCSATVKRPCWLFSAVRHGLCFCRGSQMWFSAVQFDCSAVVCRCPEATTWRFTEIMPGISHPLRSAELMLASHCRCFLIRVLNCASSAELLARLGILQIATCCT